MGRQAGTAETTGTFLGRLVRDVRGNTLAIMAAALIPLAGMVGGGIDISRMYITKTRLQHACDAGALAGRKQMGAGAWNTANNTTADQFFNANYMAGSYGSTSLTHAYTENAGKVVGTASAVLPMTLMRVLGKTSETLEVTCNSEMRLPNTDIMFVLDTTGSMGDTPSGDTQPKIASLKVAVKCFYQIVARLPTDATCTTGTPSGGTGSQVQIRFGFVPYSTNVNVGKLLSPDWFANSRPYQTREAEWWMPQGSPVVSTSNGGLASTSAQCNPTAASGYNSSSDTYSNNFTTKVTKATTYEVTGYNAGTCNYRQTVTQTTYNKVPNGGNGAVLGWHYAQLPVNVGLLKSGTSWSNSFQWPIGANAAGKTINWDGCIEERQTVSQASYSPIPSGAKDLDLDAVPTSDPTTQWGMVLPDLIYTRTDASSNWTLADQRTSGDYPNGSQYICPTPAKKLQSWSDPVLFDTYVDSFTPNGNTYHDIGLLWGGRLLSPTGIFSSENATARNGGSIDRHMIFMTDGDPCTGVKNYTAYGVNWFDRRQTDPSVVPTEGCTTTGTLTEQVNARTTALCTAIKNKNITLWVVTFGNVDPTTVTRLTNCASSSRYFSANNAAQLQQTFASIANQISQLRLTQ